ncbi:MULTISPECIES: hypothetical protein [Aeromonas]|uniref:hypothetical protein n=1 Tax=Aeromonas TaxID=642 RepID=UPI0013157AD5|nr:MULTISPECIES: hypothetical protein [Aeromonas]
MKLLVVVMLLFLHTGLLDLDMRDFLMEGAPGIEGMAKVGRADGIVLGSSGDVNSK